MRRGIKMIAGLPGTGIGGLFYMLLALWMPANEVINILRGRANPKNTQLVKNHLFLTSCIVIAVIATGWLAGLLAVMILFGIPSAGITGANRVPIENFLHIAPIILTSLTLLAVYLAMQSLRFAIRVHKSMSWK
jgi:energy-coupling factor transporter transmembrane protein EcfT